MKLSVISTVAMLAVLHGADAFAPSGAIGLLRPGHGGVLAPLPMVTVPYMVYIPRSVRSPSYISYIVYKL